MPWVIDWQNPISLGIRVGDPIAYISETRSFSNPDLLCGKAIDNRVGRAMLLQLFEDLKETDLRGNIYGRQFSERLHHATGNEGSAHRTGRVGRDTASTRPLPGLR